jgi:hypothetical protein
MWPKFLTRPRAASHAARRSARQGQRPDFCRLRLEPLEDRWLPSSYAFTPIADSGANSIFTLGSLNQPGLNDEGTEMFHSALKSGPIGVFTVDRSGALRTIALTGDVASAFPLGGAITDDGTVSLGATLKPGGGQAIFTGNGGPLTRIADTTSPGSLFSSFLSPAAPINNFDTVVLRATLTSTQTTIATERAGEPPRLLYVTGGEFTSLSQPIIQRNGDEVSFEAGLSTSPGAEGVFLGDGVTTTTIATTGGAYSALTGGVTNDKGQVVFIATLMGGRQAVVVGDGRQLTTIAETGSGFNSFFGNATINDSGQVVFAANLPGNASGIFIAQHGEVDEIIGTGDPLFGSTVNPFTTNPFAPRGFNDAGELGFAANLADGRTVLVRADPLKHGVEVTPSEPAPQLVGEPVVWTAAVAEAQPGLVYQFSVGEEGGPMHVVRDYSPSNSFSWTPMQEGVYRIKVSVKDGYDAVTTESDVEIDRVDSQVTGSAPAVTHTANPLVALYSVPPGPEGTVHVEFALLGPNPVWQSTNDLPSEPGKSTNFFVAGMLPDKTYEMRDVFSDGTTSSPLRFPTGNIPTALTFPTFTVVPPTDPGTDLGQGLIYHALPDPVVTDLQGSIVWYFDPRNSGLLTANPFIVSTPQPGGTILGFGSDRYAVPNKLGLLPRNVLREIDLAGDTVRETNIDAVNAQLKAMGHEGIYGFYHEAEHLPDGSTVALGITERTVNIDGTPTDYVGTMVLVLDENWQVKWAWDAFDHLDVNRGPILGEIVDKSDRPVNIVPDQPAVDWLHNNAVSYSPADGNLILSLRTQDWVIKIDYRNGAGDGHVVWRLGQGGDFTVNSTDLNPWFSHQHDAHYIDDNTIILLDNGNTRHASDPTADSRGQVWKLDEKTMTATLVVNIDLGAYASAEGAAQQLSNGDYSFDLGSLGNAPNISAQTVEVRPDGSKAYVLQVGTDEFRIYRIGDMYEGVSDQLAGRRRETSDGGDDSRGRSRGDRPGEAGPDVASRAATRGYSDDFGPAITAALTAPAGQPAAPATLTIAGSTSATSVPQVLVGDTDTSPAFPDPPAVSAAAARDGLFADAGDDLWHVGLGDELTRALSP